jgi:hypothetical protein
MLVLTIVLLPTTLIINRGINGTNQERLVVEASNLATANLEKIQQEASSGALAGGTQHFTYVTRSGGQSTTFTVTTQFTALAQSGGQSAFSTVCQNGGTTLLQIWSVTATVTWPGMNGAPAVTQSTEVAPGQTGAADLEDGEIAIGVRDILGNWITTPINYYVTPTGTGAAAWLSAYLAANSLPSTDLGIPGNTGTTGCGVVLGLPTAATLSYPSIPQWTWTVTLSPNPGYVDVTEGSDVIPPGDPTSAPVSLHSGQISYAVDRFSQEFQMASGITTAVSFQALNFGASCEPVGGTWTASNPSNPYVPPASCDDNAVAAAADLPMSVLNAQIPPSGKFAFGTATQSISSVLLYPFASGYSVFAGDQPESNPGYLSGGLPAYGSDTAVTLPISSAVSTATVTVPVYPLTINVSSGTATPTATETDGAAYTFTLNSVVGGKSVSGVPLGQFQIQAAGMVGTQYVWMTPTGICHQATSYASAPSGCVATSVSITE